MATGSRVSLFYPVAVESVARRWREPALTVAVIGLALAVAALGWWSHVPGETHSTPVAVVGGLTFTSVSAAFDHSRGVTPAGAIDMHTTYFETVTAMAFLLFAEERTESVVLEVGLGGRLDAKLAATGASAVTEKLEAASDTLPKDFPVLSITGYIHDDEGNSLAMINDKLVHEGEEVEPGLRLEKILGENSVFVYKGRRFRR